MSRWILVGTLVACGSSSAPTRYPELAPDPPATGDDQLVVEPAPAGLPPSVAAPAWSAGNEPAVGEKRSYPVAGPPCMPAGDYTVSWDISTAKVTKVGSMGDGFCEKMALIIPEQHLTTVRLDFPGGHPAWVWSGQSQSVVSVGECDLQINSDPARARIHFVGGAGSGTADYSISTGHAMEACHVRGARFSVAKK